MTEIAMSGATFTQDGIPAGMHPMEAAPVHLLDAGSEQKLFHPAIGRMPLTPCVKVALFAVRGYLGVMALLVGLKLIAGLMTGT